MFLFQFYLSIFDWLGIGLHGFSRLYASGLWPGHRFEKLMWVWQNISGWLSLNYQGYRFVMLTWID
jgi:hypothetical protein